MKRVAVALLSVFCLGLMLLPITAQQGGQGKQGNAKAPLFGKGRGGGGRRGRGPAFQPTAEQKSQVQTKVDAIDAIVKNLRAKNTNEDLLADVDVYAKAGKWLIEFPENFINQQGVEQALTVLDQGIERAKMLDAGNSPWVMAAGRKALGYYSALDGSVQPMGVTIPRSYDGSKAVPLYVWLHGRSQTLSEANFLNGFTEAFAPRGARPNLTYSAADEGQIIVDAYGRWNNANHWAGEVDIFEAIAAVEKRFKIDPDRIVLRGFSLGGAGAWHNALHRPGFWAAAEIGAGTWPRRLEIAEAAPDQYPEYQRATLHIWENIIDWALNAYNLPIAAHDGDSDTQIASIPGPPRGAYTRGQLESSIRVREQLAKEGLPSVGEPSYLRVPGTPSIFQISAQTGHSISPYVRQKNDEFLHEWVTKGRQSWDHIRFVTFTTRYNNDHWVNVEGLQKHYQRADVDAQRSEDGRTYDITTKNVSRLVLTEANRAARIKIDGQTLNVNGAAQIALDRTGSAWKVGSARWEGLHKTHALQGPIDDAFLDPFLLVKPTGTPWNKDANDQALRILAFFDQTYARWYRAHPRVKNDTEVTDEDFAKYNVVLFGDPGSNSVLAKVAARLPVRWTKESISVGSRNYPSASNIPALVYPNPLNPSHYVVVNSGLTIAANEYQADYSMPRLGDFAVLKVAADANVPEVAEAGLFDEAWQLPK